MNRIKHFGSANVSIVDTKTNKIISPNLVYWAKYADEKKATVVDETKFSFTIPTDLGAKCATAGDCVGSPLFSSQYLLSFPFRLPEFFLPVMRIIESFWQLTVNRSSSGGGMGLERDKRMNPV